jgi:hypothetical protein
LENTRLRGVQQTVEGRKWRYTILPQKDASAAVIMTTLGHAT